jgi:hypothetical protein
MVKRFREGLAAGCLFLWTTAVSQRAGAEIPADSAEPGYLETIGPGTVDWSRRVVFANGTSGPTEKTPKSISSARLASERRAVKAASTTLLEALNALRIEGDVLGNAPLANEQVKTGVAGLIRACESDQIEYLPNSEVQVRLTCSLDGGIAMFLAPLNGDLEQTEPPKPTTELVVVDATSTKLLPSLRPRILGPDETVLFACDKVERSLVRSQGCTKFLSKLPEKGSVSLKSIGLGPRVTDVVLGAEDAKKLAANDSAMRLGMVVFLVAGPNT